MIGLWLEIESRCNWECSFCYNPWRFGLYDGPPRLDAAQTLADIDALAAAVPIEQCTISGGEPTLVRSDILLDLVEGLSVRGIRCVMTTNGTRLDADLVRSLDSAGLSSVQISLHSGVPATHDALTQRNGSFESALRGALQVASSDMELWLTMVIGSMNLGDTAPIVRLAHALGAGVILNEVTPTVSRTTEMDSLLVSDEAAMSRAVVAALETAERLGGVRVEPGSPFEHCQSTTVRDWAGARDSACPVQAELSRLTLDSGGVVRTCNHSPATIGSLREESATVLLDRAQSWARAARSQSSTACLYSDTPVELVALGPTRLAQRDR